MATHSSILAGRIPWTEETDGLRPMGSQRAGHDWRDLAQHSTIYSQPGMRTQVTLAYQFVDDTFLTSAYNTNCKVSFTSSRRSQRLQVLPQSWAFLHPQMH